MVLIKNNEVPVQLEPELFRPQVRAILRASASGDVRIMLPMLTNLWEAEQAKGVIREVIALTPPAARSTCTRPNAVVATVDLSAAAVQSVSACLPSLSTSAN